MTEELAEKEMTQTQVDAFDVLMENGGDSKWVLSNSVGHHQTIKALVRRRIIQVAEINGAQHCALAGVYLERDLGE